MGVGLRVFCQRQKEYLSGDFCGTHGWSTESDALWDGWRKIERNAGGDMVYWMIW